ncbi:MAG: hypothetical protein HYW90_02180 [Candidatus Sungbacteria bacterium]|nr:hypothetical protein [Candidatus Sungbacteria bacterium]
MAKKNIPAVDAPRAGPVDFSSGSVAKAVRKKIFENGFAMVTIPLGLIGALALAVLEPSLLFVVIAAGGTGLGLSSWVFNYFRKDSIANHYIRKLREQMIAERKGVLERLTRELAAFSKSEGAGSEYAEQGVQQFALAERGFNALHEILSDKLSQGELMFGRFLGTAEQLYLAILDNLREIANLLKSIDATDMRYITDRLKKLERMKVLQKADQEEVETLKVSKLVHEEQLEKINVLLTRNEEALTQLDRTRFAVAQMRTGGEATLDVETAREELESLIRRARGSTGDSFIRADADDEKSGVKK